MDCNVDKEINVSNERMAWIDAVKGLAVILVLFAHALPSSPVEDVISTFHVPLFVVVTGYLIGECNFDKGECVKKYKKTFVKNFVPYLVYTLIAVPLNIFVSILIQDFSVLSILKNVYGTLTGFGGSYALWFVASYLIGLAIYYLIRCNVHKYSVQLLISFFSLIIAVLYDYKIDNILQTINIKFELGFIFEYPIVSVLRAFTFVFYFEVGRFLKRSLLILSIKKIVLCFALFFSVIPISIINGYTNYSFLNHGKYPFVLYYCGTMGSLGVIVLFRILYEKQRFKILEFSGTYSLLIMSTHMNWEILFFVQVFINNCLYRLPKEQGVLFYLYGVICVILMLVVEWVMIKFIKLIKNKLRYRINE